MSSAPDSRPRPLWPYKHRCAISVAIMAVGCAVGVVLAAHEAEAMQLTATIAETRRRVCDGTLSFSLRGAVSLASQNSMVVANLILGALTLGVRVVLQLFHSGADLGVHYAAAIRNGSHWFALSALVPHGVFELSAFASAGATGFGFTHVVWRFLIRRYRPGRGELVLLANELALPLSALMIAAIVEEFVTPYLMKVAMNCW